MIETLFSITTTSRWIPERSEKLVDNLNDFLELRTQYDIKLLVKEVQKRGLKLMEHFSLTDVDTHKNRIIKKLKNADNKDMVDMVFRLETTYDEIIDILDTKSNAASSTG